MTDDMKGIDHDGNFFRIKCSPEKPVVLTGPGERALGGMFEVETLNEPRSQAEVDLAGDTFFNLWKNSVTMGEPPQERELNKTLLEWASSKPGFISGKSNTVGNIPAALASAGFLWESLMSEDALKEALEEQEKAEEKRKEAEEHYQQAAQQLGDGDQQGAEQSQQQGNQAMSEANSLAQQATDKVKKLQNNPLAQGMMGSVTKKAAEKGEKVAATMKSWGVEPGDVTKEDASEIVQVSDDVNIQQIAELIGRFQGISSRTIEAAKAGYTGIVAEPDITQDVERLFPLEVAYLSKQAPPHLHAEYATRFMQGGLLGWKPRHEGRKKGAFVAYVDKSSSMWDMQLSIAKGLALGIAKSVKEDDSLTDRYYRLRFFDSGDPLALPTVTSDDNWRKHLEWGRVQSSGGTRFNEAFRAAMVDLREAKDNGVDGADLLLITDEESSLSQEVIGEWLKLADEIGTQLHVVSIGGSGLPELREIATTVIVVSEAAFQDEADNIVETITTAIVKGELKQ